jgi:NAD-dependent SIR2 family protein deacetylase
VCGDFDCPNHYLDEQKPETLTFTVNGRLLTVRCSLCDKTATNGLTCRCEVRSCQRCKQPHIVKVTYLFDFRDPQLLDPESAYHRAWCPACNAEVAAEKHLRQAKVLMSKAKALRARTKEKS